ncbi:50S ribosomal protein L30e-like protein [Entophlyctis helioformis]|nr:50S ribosomal protein L30e-like protein [Entophlyctis helioformis]
MAARLWAGCEAWLGLLDVVICTILIALKATRLHMGLKEADERDKDRNDSDRDCPCNAVGVHLNRATTMDEMVALALAVTFPRPRVNRIALRRFPHAKTASTGRLSLRTCDCRIEWNGMGWMNVAWLAVCEDVCRLHPPPPTKTIIINMSAEGEVVEVAEQVQVAADATPKGPMTVEEALQEVLKKALINDGLARGIRESVKALDRREAHLAVLVETCTEGEYVKLIEALCAEHSINLIKVSDAKKLGEWVGLCKIDREGNARKVVGCSVCVVRDFGEDSEAMNVLLDYFKTR